MDSRDKREAYRKWLRKNVPGTNAVKPSVRTQGSLGALTKKLAERVKEK